MILKRAKNSRPADADLRESYRQRLNEIFESGRSDDGFQEPLLEPVTPADPPQMESAPEPVGSGDDQQASAADPLSQTAERVARSLTYGLVAILNSQERRRGVETAKLETIEDQVLAAISRIDARLDTLATSLHGQQLEVSFLRQRLDSQAEVVQELRDAIRSQQGRWNEYRTAVERLKTITNVSNLPVHLPDDL